MHRPGLRDDEDDEDETPAFVALPREAEQSLTDRTSQELNATLRLDAERAAAARRRVAGRSGSRAPVTSESSMSSGSVRSGALVNVQGDDRRAGQPASTLSPRRAADGPGLGARRSTASGREASDGTPSMGSSFSDLDGRFQALVHYKSGVLTCLLRCQCHTICA